MQIITKVWKQQPGRYFCISTKSASGAWRDIFFTRIEFKKVLPFLRNNMDKHLYWCPHGFSEKRRVKDAAVLPKLLWADIDELEPQTVKPKPSILWESSPGRYAGIWILDEEIPSDSLNRDLTYKIGADRGGWDLTQVLRVPGSKNFKYRSQPVSKLIWADGPSYTIQQIKRFTKQQKETLSNIADFDTVYKKYEKQIPRNIRTHIKAKEATQGKRSEVLWKIEHALIDANIPLEDAVAIIQGTVWNKFAGRRDELRQIERELQKIIDERPTSPESPKQSDYKFLNVTLADVEDKPIDWLWYPYIARGELTILEGMPGVGKSYLMQMVSKAICDGDALPCYRSEMKKRVQSKVAYFDIENSAYITKKRMLSNGLKNLNNFIVEEEPFTVDQIEWDEVLDALEKQRPALVVFDTLNTYIGNIDTNNGAQVQAAFSEFRQIARRFNCAVVVLRHWTKNASEKALIDRGQNSIAFTGLSRVVMACMPHPQEANVNILGTVKFNIGKHPPPLNYEILASPIHSDPDQSKFIWGTYENDTSFETLATEKHQPDEKVFQQAEELIVDELKSGEWILKSQLVSLAEGRSISRRTIERAIRRLLEQKVIKKTLKGSRAIYKKI